MGGALRCLLACSKSPSPKNKTSAQKTNRDLGVSKKLLSIVVTTGNNNWRSRRGRL
jgi:hypothetical protein